MEQELMTAIYAGISGVVLAFIGFISKRITAKLEAFAEEKNIADKIKSKQYLVQIAVEATEQVWIEEKGAQKLEKAKEMALKILAEEGYDIGAEQMNAFIEAAVYSINKGIKEGKEEKRGK